MRLTVNRALAPTAKLHKLPGIACFLLGAEAAWAAVAEGAADRDVAARLLAGQLAHPLVDTTEELSLLDILYIVKYRCGWAQASCKTQRYNKQLVGHSGAQSAGCR